MRTLPPHATGKQEWSRSLKLQKVLQGQQNTPKKFPLRESKLDKGHRILWQERSNKVDGGTAAGASSDTAEGSILIWYIVKHDNISAQMKQVDECYKRMKPEDIENAVVMGRAEMGIVEQQHNSIPEVLLDPQVTPTRTQPSARARMHRHTQACMHMRVNKHARTQARMYVQARARTHTRACMHAHTHAHFPPPGQHPAASLQHSCGRPATARG